LRQRIGSWRIYWIHEANSATAGGISLDLDAVLPLVQLDRVEPIAREAEDVGFKALWSAETIHDPFLPGAIIAVKTQKLEFGTSIAVSFARSPTTLAYTAWDLSQASNGRFILGLGTQIKAHIVRRFGMTWPDSVVGKLREQIVAIRALWQSWQTGERLNFRGEYYKLTLMAPFFNPGPIPHPDIPIYIAGVNTGLARLAGEVANGFLVHPFHSIEYLQQVLKPAIAAGADKTRREDSGIKLSATVFVITEPEDEIFVRSQLSFYASTPSYRSVMALHGWEDTAERLSKFAAQGKWDEMPSLITDDMLATFAVKSDCDHLPQLLATRYEGLVDRISLYRPYLPGERDEFWQLLVDGFRKL
jgi:probable F420-dependent oxidoreductase